MENNKGWFKLVDLIGLRVGKLEVNKYHAKTKSGHYWECICDCGNTTIVSSAHLTSNKRKTRSCGCLKKETKHTVTHGLRNHPLYEVWRSMKSRCYNDKSPNYNLYGGRGIIVCDKWVNDFKAFYDDMNDGYVKGETSIERIELDGNYEPSNCCWANNIQQANNKRNSKYITYNGIVRTAAEWGRYLGIKDDTINHRIKRGYTTQEALFGKPYSNRNQCNMV